MATYRISLRRMDFVATKQNSIAKSSAELLLTHFGSLFKILSPLSEGPVENDLLESWAASSRFWFSTSGGT